MASGSAKLKSESLVAKERDLYTWARQTATLLREGRVGDLDLAAVAEGIDDVGEEQYLRLESASRVLMDHLLKWDHQPAARSRSWAITIREQRRQLRKNPSLKGRLDEALADAWEDARDEAARETGLPTRTFPADSPYAFAEIMERP